MIYSARSFTLGYTSGRLPSRVYIYVYLPRIEVYPILVLLVIMTHVLNFFTSCKCVIIARVDRVEQERIRTAARVRACNSNRSP